MNRWLSWMKFCTIMYTLTTSRALLNIKVISQRSRSQDQIFRCFTIARYGKKFVNMITHESLHLAWWSFAWTCIAATSRTLLNFKIIGQRSRSQGFLCVFSAWYPLAVLSLSIFEIRTYFYGILHCASKNVPLCHCPYLRQILTDFNNSFTTALWTIWNTAIIKCPTTP